MSAQAFTCTLTFLSDWHIGSGGGRHGAIDRLMDRDGDGLPYVPASSLRGIWRDAAERLALGLDHDGQAASVSDGPWQRFVKEIFGIEVAGQPGQGTQPGRGRLILEDMRLPAALRAAVKEDRRLKAALTFVKPGVAIDPKSGRAREDFLRFEEMGRAGTVLEGQGWLVFPPGREPDEERLKFIKAFLLASSLLVERIGGKRRRGAGRCLLDVRFDDLKAEEALSLLKQAKPPSAPDGQAGSAATLARYHDESKETGWIEIPLEARVLTPVIIPDQVMGNVVTTRDHVPGTYLLYHVARWLESQGFHDAWGRIAAGDVQVLPLYPARDGRPGQPTPHCLSHPKDAEKAPVCNELPGPDACPTGNRPLKGGYVWTKEKTLDHLPSVPQVLRTHNVVDDARQRPTEAVGGVYTFEALEPGLTLAGTIRIRKNLWPGDAPKIDALAGTVHIGRASRMGYGRVVLTPGEVREVAPPEDAKDHLTILLRTDTLLPGETLGGATHFGALAQAIAALVGGTAEDLFDLEQARAYLTPVRLEGWQQTWQRPRPSLVGLAAGSAVRLPLKKTIPGKALAALQGGLGERRGEGFGQVEINPSCLEHPELTYTRLEADAVIARSSEAKDKQRPDSGKASDSFARTIETAAWKAAIIEAAEAAAFSQRETRLQWEAKGAKPGSSQLGVLRTLLLAADSIEGLKTDLNRWIQDIKDKGKDGRWGGSSVLDRLKAFVDAGEIWEVLEEQLKPDRWPKPITTSEEAMKAALELFALRAFLLRAIHYHRRALEKTQPPRSFAPSQEKEAMQ